MEGPPYVTFFYGHTPKRRHSRLRRPAECAAPASLPFSLEQRPWPCLHIPQVSRFPFIFRMGRQKGGGQKILAIGVTHMRPELQVFGQCGGSDLRLNRTTGEKRRPA